MFIKIFFFLCISCLFFNFTSAQTPTVTYQEKINSYIKKYSKNSLELTRIENKIQTLLNGDISWEKRMILEYFNDSINKYLTEKKSRDLHIKIPKNVKALYYSAYSASRNNKIEDIISMTQKLEINAIIIDVKEVDGLTSFKISNESFGKIFPSSNNRITDISALIKKLHENNIYIIGRIVVFKDNYLPAKRPDLAIKWSYNNNKIWGDYKGNSYSDPYSKEVWDYHIEIASAIYKLGFDEINFDYVRFPTDGYISQTYYPLAHKVLSKNKKFGKIQVMKEFSQYITKSLKKRHPNIILSADLFGLATHTNLYQIGQNIETFIPYFDFVAPMIYPSHYGKGYLGYQIPDNAPYQIFYDSIQKAQKRIDIFNESLSGSLQKQIPYSKIRPWLQGFNCSWCPGATSYNREKFRKQIQALNKLGLDSWYVWNASGRYESSWYNPNQ